MTVVTKTKTTRKSSNDREGSGSGESLARHSMRSTKNCFTRCFGEVKATDQRAKIKLKERNMAQRKKEFGVEYMTKVETDASEEDLQACIQACKDDLRTTQAEIASLQEEIDHIEEQTESKIQKKPTVTSKTGGTLTAAPAPSGDPAYAEAPSPAATASRK
jgi:chromosome segregation ATPase